MISEHFIQIGKL